MEGSSRGGGYFRDFKTQAQTSEDASVAAQEQTPGALRVVAEPARQLLTLRHALFNQELVGLAVAGGRSSLRKDD